MRNLLIIASLLASPVYLFSISSRDSLREIWENNKLPDSIRFDAIKSQYENNNSDVKFNLNLTYFHFALASNKKSKTERFAARHKNAILHYYQGQLDSAAISLELARKEFDERGDSLQVARTYLLEGSILVEQRNFLKAIDRFIFCLAHCKKHGLIKYEILVLNNLAAVSSLIRSYDLSNDYLNKAEALTKEYGIKTGFGNIWLNKGNNYLQKEQYDSTIINVNRAYDFFTNCKNTYGQSSCYYVLAFSYYKLNQYQKAMGLIKKSLAIDQSLVPNEIREMEGQILLGLITLETDPKAARIIGSDLADRVDEETPQDIRRGIFDLLYQCHKKLGNVEKALEVLELFRISNDSMLVEEDRFEVTRKIVEYQFETDTGIIKEEIQEDYSKIKVNHYEKLYYFAGLFLLLAVILIIAILSVKRKVQ